MSQRPTGAPGQEGQAGRQIGDSYSSQIPWVGIVRAIGSAIDFGGGGANRRQRQTFREAGGTIVHKGKGRWSFTYQGQRVSEKRAIQIARQFRRGLLPSAPSVASPADAPRGAGFPGIGYAAWLALQPRGPRTRGRKRKKRKTRTTYPRGGLPGVPWMEPGRWCDMVNDPMCVENPDEGGWDLPRSAPPSTAYSGLPTRVPNPDVVVGGAGRALARWLPWLLIFVPGRIGEEAPLPMPTQPGQPTGPRRRYRVTPRPRLPATMPEPAPLPAPAPTPRDPAARPSSRPGLPVQEPLPSPGARPAPAPDPAPRSRPIPGPGAPSPTTGRPPAPSSPRTRLPFDPLTLLPLLLTPKAPARIVERYRPPVQSPLPIEAPLTSPFAYGVPSPRTDECQCDKPRKRRKSQCRNPITSRTTRTRGGRRYRTITRRLDCK